MTVDSRPAPAPVDTNLLRRTFGAFATGVTVVTVGGDRPHGMTANSFASVSLDPPLLLVCVDRNAAMHARLSETGVFGVSVLADSQQGLARYFADRRRPTAAAQFEAVDWRPGARTGVPLIEGALAGFECELWRAYDGGDHTIFLGRLLALDGAADEDPLLFFRGGFLARPEPAELTA